jgi:hypothetical protein
MHPEFATVVTHYGETRDEKARRLGTHPTCWEYRDTPLCGNGSYHAKTARRVKLVDCAACLEKLKGD